jgi:hypothetical protein
MIQTLFLNDAVFKDDSAPFHTAVTVQSWFEGHEGELIHLPWPAQSPDLIIIEPLWTVLETSMRNRFPPPTFLKQLEDALQEEWYYKFLLEIVRNLYESIPRIAAVLKAEGGTTAVERDVTAGFHSRPNNFMPLVFRGL